MPYALLLLAILIEVGASLALKMSAGFTRPLPSLAALLGFGTALALLAHITTQLPLSLTYPTWAGLGIVGASLGAMIVFGEQVTPQRWLGIAMIIVGLTVMYAPALPWGAKA
jgi:small multidrug resistance pump